MTRTALIAAAALVAMSGAASAGAHKADKMMMNDYRGTVVNQSPYLATLKGAELMANGDVDSTTTVMVQRGDGTSGRGTRTTAGVKHDDDVRNTAIDLHFKAGDPSVRGAKGAATK